jgi:formate--tetrahydrofolate ligase
LCRHWAEGGAGAEALARSVAALADANPDPALRFRTLYPDAMPLEDKLRTVAQEIYRAADISLSPAAARQLKAFTEQGFGKLPVCMAKTPYSFTANEKLRGAVSGHTLPIREVRLSAGAGFVVALCGDINTMPGLPRDPAANHIGLDDQGRIVGLS